MRITALGHAGFFVESDQALVVTDPWLSPTGAFDSAWMQLPRNHHLADSVRQTLGNDPRARYLYVSHEHRDHFDPEFLASLPNRDVTVVLARFGRTALREQMQRLGFERIVVLEDGERLEIPGGYLRMWSSDESINRDSALLVRLDGQGFLDLNDCKIHDRLEQIVREEPVDVFTAQFSGAIWHPTSYDIDRKSYEAISRAKAYGKFEAVARAIATVKPRRFLASAGPVAFLDPELIHINFQPTNIFPRADRFFKYLRGRLRDACPTLADPMPGDRLDVETDTLSPLGTERYTEASFEGYIQEYALRMRPVFEQRRRELPREELFLRFEQLREALSEKLRALSVADRVRFTLFAAFRELPQRILRVDFAAGEVTEVPSISAPSTYVFLVNAADFAPVLDRRMGWEEFLLSCRQTLRRSPDRYDSVLHGYLANEVEDLPEFSEQIRAREGRNERLVVEAGGQQYSVRRYCPHQGADLAEAWIQGNRYLVCPRHRWRFDLHDAGRCGSEDATVDAQPCGPGGEAREEEAPGPREEAAPRQREETAGNYGFGDLRLPG